MSSIKFTNLFPALASFLLGCVTYYVFLCFNGVVLAHSSRIEVFILRTLFKLVPPNNKDAKVLIFSFVTNTEHALVNLLVIFLFLYFIADYLANNTIANSLFVTIGAVTTDLYYYKTNPFDLSYFFSEGYKVDLVSLTIWFVCTVASIKSVHCVRVKRQKENVQPLLGPCLSRAKKSPDDFESLF